MGVWEWRSAPIGGSAAGFVPRLELLVADAQAGVQGVYSDPFASPNCVLRPIPACQGSLSYDSAPATASPSRPYGRPT